MKLFTIAKIEIKKSFKATFILSLFMGLFVIMIMAIFDPELFAGFEEIMDVYPDAIKAMVGSALDLGTIGGLYTAEFYLKGGTRYTNYYRE